MLVDVSTIKASTKYSIFDKYSFFYSKKTFYNFIIISSCLDNNLSSFVSYKYFFKGLFLLLKLSSSSIDINSYLLTRFVLMTGIDSISLKLILFVYLNIFTKGFLSLNSNFFFNNFRSFFYLFFIFTSNTSFFTNNSFFSLGSIFFNNSFFSLDFFSSLYSYSCSKYSFSLWLNSLNSSYKKEFVISRLPINYFNRSLFYNKKSNFFSNSLSSILKSGYRNTYLHGNKFASLKEKKSIKLEENEETIKKDKVDSGIISDEYLSDNSLFIKDSFISKSIYSFSKILVIIYYLRWFHFFEEFSFVSDSFIDLGINKLLPSYLNNSFNLSSKTEEDVDLVDSDISLKTFDSIESRTLVDIINTNNVFFSCLNVSVSTLPVLVSSIVSNVSMGVNSLLITPIYWSLMQINYSKWLSFLRVIDSKELTKEKVIGSEFILKKPTRITWKKKNRFFWKNKRLQESVRRDFVRVMRHELRRSHPTESKKSRDSRISLFYQISSSSLLAMAISKKKQGKKLDILSSALFLLSSKGRNRYKNRRRFLSKKSKLIYSKHSISSEKVTSSTIVNKLNSNKVSSILVKKSKKKVLNIKNKALKAKKVKSSLLNKKNSLLATDTFFKKKNKRVKVSLEENVTKDTLLLRKSKTLLRKRSTLLTPIEKLTVNSKKQKSMFVDTSIILDSNFKKRFTFSLSSLFNSILNVSKNPLAILNHSRGINTFIYKKLSLFSSSYINLFNNQNTRKQFSFYSFTYRKYRALLNYKNISLVNSMLFSIKEFSITSSNYYYYLLNLLYTDKYSISFKLFKKYFSFFNYSFNSYSSLDFSLNLFFMFTSAKYMNSSIITNKRGLYVGEQLFSKHFYPIYWSYLNKNKLFIYKSYFLSKLFLGKIFNLYFKNSKSTVFKVYYDYMNYFYKKEFSFSRVKLFSSLNLNSAFSVWNNSSFLAKNIIFIDKKAKNTTFYNRTGLVWKNFVKKTFYPNGSYYLQNSFLNSFISIFIVSGNKSKIIKYWINVFKYLKTFFNISNPFLYVYKIILSFRKHSTLMAFKFKKINGVKPKRLSKYMSYGYTVKNFKSLFYFFSEFIDLISNQESLYISQKMYSVFQNKNKVFFKQKQFSSKRFLSGKKNFNLDGKLLLFILWYSKFLFVNSDSFNPFNLNSFFNYTRESYYGKWNKLYDEEKVLTQLKYSFSNNKSQVDSTINKESDSTESLENIRKKHIGLTSWKKLRNYKSKFLNSYFQGNHRIFNRRRKARSTYRVNYGSFIKSLEWAYNVGISSSKYYLYTKVLLYKSFKKDRNLHSYLLNSFKLDQFNRNFMKRFLKVVSGLSCDFFEVTIQPTLYIGKTGRRLRNKYVKGVVSFFNFLVLGKNDSSLSEISSVFTNKYRMWKSSKLVSNKKYFFRNKYVSFNEGIFFRATSFLKSSLSSSYSLSFYNNYFFNSSLTSFLSRSSYFLSNMGSELLLRDSVINEDLDNLSFIDILDSIGNSISERGLSVSNRLISSNYYWNFFKKLSLLNNFKSIDLTKKLVLEGIFDYEKVSLFSNIHKKGINFKYFSSSLHNEYFFKTNSWDTSLNTLFSSSENYNSFFKIVPFLNSSLNVNVIKLLLLFNYKTDFSSDWSLDASSLVTRKLSFYKKFRFGKMNPFFYIHSNLLVTSNYYSSNSEISGDSVYSFAYTLFSVSLDNSFKQNVFNSDIDSVSLVVLKELLLIVKGGFFNKKYIRYLIDILLLSSSFMVFYSNYLETNRDSLSLISINHPFKDKRIYYLSPLFNNNKMATSYYLFLNKVLCF